MLAFRVSGTDDVPAAVEAVIEEYAKLEEGDDCLLDLAVGLDDETGIVEVEITVEAGSVDGAAGKGMGSFRTAVHATGAATPDWSTAGEGLAFVLEAESGLRTRPLVDA